MCIYDGRDYRNAISAKAFLESSGIITIMPNERHVGLQPYLNLAIGRFKLFVKEDDVTDAVEILEAYSFIDSSEKIEIDAKTKPEVAKPRKCQKCGSQNVDRISVPRRLLILLLYLLGGVPLEINKVKYKCLECNHSWR
nr:hypothetical protein [Marispirochaeta sp.]